MLYELLGMLWSARCCDHVRFLEVAGRIDVDMDSVFYMSVIAPLTVVCAVITIIVITTCDS